MSNQNEIVQYFGNESIKTRFRDVLGHNTGPYIASILLAVASNDKLQTCSPKSIYSAALQAASLRLSVDPNTGQAYLVPFGNKATLIVGYKGLYDLAVRTGKYRYINVTPIYEGEVVEEDRLSGFHSIKSPRTSKTVIGWLAAFEMTNGFGKTMYMTCQEIHGHAKKYSKGYEMSGGGWKTNTDAMERKTVLRLLLRRWGYLDPSESGLLDEIEAASSEYVNQDLSDAASDVIEGDVVQPVVHPEDVTNAILYAFVKEGVSKNMPHARELFNRHCPQEFKTDAEKAVYWGKLYREHRNNGLETLEAAALATQDVQGPAVPDTQETPVPDALGKPTKDAFELYAALIVEAASLGLTYPEINPDLIKARALDDVIENIKRKIAAAKKPQRTQQDIVMELGYGS